jgi:putative spermidine/putrescine transport system permease protein
MNVQNKEKVYSAIVYLYLVFVCILILMPLGITLYRAIFNYDENGNLVISINAYFTISEGFWEKLQTSLAIALVTVAVTMAVSLPVAYGIVRYEFRGKKLLFTLLNGVWYVPGVTYGLSLVLAYYFVYRFLLGFWGFVAAYSTGFMLLSLLTTIVAFKNFDPVYEEAARCLGAGRLQTFLRVTLPLIGPGITAGVILVLVLSLNEFITALLISLPTRVKTAPLQVFSDIRHAGVRPFVAAEATVLQLVSLAIVIIYLKFFGTKYLRGSIMI